MFGFSPTSMRSSLGKLFWSYYIRLSMCAATASIDRIELRGPLTEIGTATSDKLKSKRFCGKLNIQIFSLRAGSFECIFWASDFTRSFTWLLITFVVNKARKFAHPFSARRNYHRQPKRTMCGFGLQRSFGRNILELLVYYLMPNKCKNLKDMKSSTFALSQTGTVDRAKLTTLPRESDVLSIWRGRQAPRFKSRRITVRLRIMAKRSWPESMRNAALLGLMQPNLETGARRAGRYTLIGLTGGNFREIGSFVSNLLAFARRGSVGRSPAFPFFIVFSTRWKESRLDGG